MARGPEVDDEAPDFTLPSHRGADVRLADAAARGPVVLYFYPKDDTFGCTRESCAFRDAYAELSAAGATVIGVSGDDLESHARFAAKYALPYDLCADVHGHVRRLYGVPSAGLASGRMTFVIDRHRRVRRVYASRIRFEAHVDEALKTIRGLRDP